MFRRIKRLDRGLVISAIGHLGLLVIGLLYLGASAHEAPPPEATLVELVRPQDIPHFSGAPTDLRTSGLDTPSPKSQPAVRPQQAKPQPEQKEQKQQRDAQKSAPPQPKTPPLPQMEVGEAVNAPLEQPPPDPPPPAEAPTPDADATAAQRAQMALLGGRSAAALTRRQSIYRSSATISPSRSAAWSAPARQGCRASIRARGSACGSASSSIATAR